MANVNFDRAKPQCSLILFLATRSEEDGLLEALNEFGLPCQTVKRKNSGFVEDYHWLGQVGHDLVVAMRPPRADGGGVVMGSIGRLGTAARAIRLRDATGAQGIVQLGMAFGIDPARQKLGDVLVSKAIIPYDNRDVKPHPDGREGYVTSYTQVTRERARPALVGLFEREQVRIDHPYDVSLGAVLSGAARIHCAAYRDELVRLVPAGDDPIIGGEMEGVGLLAASVATDDPIWCVVKAISDFADENRDEVVEGGRKLACLNAARFVLSALLNDAK